MLLLLAFAVVAAVCALVGAVLVARRTPPGDGTSKGPRHARDKDPRD